MRTFEDFKTTLKKSPKKKCIGVIAAQDEHTLDAVILAANEGLIEPVLIGDEAKIKRILTELNCPINNIEIQNISDPIDCAKQGAQLVHEGKLDCLMKGKIETGALMKVMVNKDYGIRASNTMSVLTFVDSPYYHKIFALTDGALMMYPTLEQKKDMIVNAVKAFASLGISNPKVSVLGAVEHVNPKMKETVEGAQLKEMWQRNEITGCILEGPIAYDLAMCADAAQIKEYQSPVAGDTDILLVPDITAGNILIKSLGYTGGAMLAGAVVGALVPIIITSRSSSMQDKYMSIVINALIGKSNKRGEIYEDIQSFCN